jgi:hypothetical protein
MPVAICQASKSRSSNKLVMKREEGYLKTQEHLTGLLYSMYTKKIDRASSQKFLRRKNRTFNYLKMKRNSWLDKKNVYSTLYTPVRLKW